MSVDKDSMSHSMMKHYSRCVFCLSPQSLNVNLRILVRKTSEYSYCIDKLYRVLFQIKSSTWLWFSYMRRHSGYELGFHIKNQSFQDNRGYHLFWTIHVFHLVTLNIFWGPNLNSCATLDSLAFFIFVKLFQLRCLVQQDLLTQQDL